jgi:hypothetical protein
VYQNIELIFYMALLSGFFSLMVIFKMGSVALGLEDQNYHEIESCGSLLY